MLLSNDGGVLSDFAEVRKKVLAAVTANFSSVVCRALPLACRRRLLDRIARSLIDYRSTRWPYSPTLARQQDALQRRCIATVAGTPRTAEETVDEWQRRRSREHGSVARSWGLWSARHSMRLQSWRDHVDRERCRDTMLWHCWSWHDAEWRREQRRLAGSRSVFAGRLGLRTVTHVQPRWQESIPEAT